MAERIPGYQSREDSEYAAAWQFCHLGWWVPRSMQRQWPNPIKSENQRLWKLELTFVERLQALRAFVADYCEPGELEDWTERYRVPRHGQMPGQPPDQLIKRMTIGELDQAGYQARYDSRLVHSIDPRLDPDSEHYFRAHDPSLDPAGESVEPE